ncbi:hypothetical protein DRQ36_07480 [bacterium]|nr:MAG: hypothetical protein DRQ36_07480 [bacterium]
MTAIVTGEYLTRGTPGGNALAIGMSGYGAAGIPTGCGHGGAVAGWIIIIALADAITMSITITMCRDATGCISTVDTAIVTL